jgi:hypothetical protein
MVLAFDSTSKFGEAVFGSTSSQTAGSNGAIVQHNPSASAPVSMKGGKRQNKKSQKRQNGGKNKRRSQRQKKNKKSQRQRGGK